MIIMTMIVMIINIISINISFKTPNNNNVKLAHFI